MAKDKTKEKREESKISKKRSTKQDTNADVTKKVEKKRKTSKAHGDTPKPSLSLIADEGIVDKGLSSLFASKPAPAQPRNTEIAVSAPDDDSDDTIQGDPVPETHVKLAPVAESQTTDASPDPRRKRKRKDAGDDLEDAYMKKLAREEQRDVERNRSDLNAKRLKRETEKEDQAKPQDEDEDEDESQASTADDEAGLKLSTDDDEMDKDPPPKHETQQAAEDEASKANRTVFLGNVSTTAISSKTARKTLMHHLASFFPKLSVSETEQAKYRVESIRFRSTPYASAIPKKAAYAKKELMDATTKSTNAYAVYSSQLLSREAVKHLNGTVVLDRHLRVDEVAHPAKVDNRRCVFVGNLGFVDDESNIQDANEEEGREVRKRSKIPADAEEGLWRTFGKCGKVESVRVIRDSTTRVGKGIAYVQFDDENAVEAALLLNEKKFPPMLPRKLRVTRAKAQKKNAKPGSGRPSARPATHGYQRKVTGAELTQMGRAGKLFGRAAAAKVAKGGSSNNAIPVGIRKPENFVFEGHRASSKSGKSGLRLGKKGKPTNRSAKRGAVFKAKKKA